MRWILNRAGLYPEVKDSRLYDAYRWAFYRSSWNRLEEQLALVRAMLRGSVPKIVIDAGANKGERAAVYRRVARRVVCVEPDSYCLEILRRRFRHRRGVVIVPMALANHGGIRTLYVQGQGSGLNTLSSRWKEALMTGAGGRFAPVAFSGQVEVETTTLDTLIARYGRPRYIKLDVEGSEYEALKGLSERVAFVSFEANLPEMIDSTLGSLKRLGELARDVTFSYSTADGMMGSRLGWFGLDEMVELVHRTDTRFFEILACLEKDARHELDGLVTMPR